jgi:hypothetical protein
MDRANDYLTDAVECIRLAKRQASIEQRARLLQMAEAWIYLADRLRRKWRVCGPQIPSSTTAEHKQISAAFLLRLEKSLCAADLDRVSEGLAVSEFRSATDVERPLTPRQRAATAIQLRAGCAQARSPRRKHQRSGPVCQLSLSFKKSPSVEWFCGVSRGPRLATLIPQKLPKNSVGANPR